MANSHVVNTGVREITSGLGAINQSLKNLTDGFANIALKAEEGKIEEVITAVEDMKAICGTNNT